jgi:hypothetical protein
MGCLGILVFVTKLPKGEFVSFFVCLIQLQMKRLLFTDSNIDIECSEFQSPPFTMRICMS